MLDESTRAAILKLHQEGHGSRAIAHMLQVSRGAVKDVIKAGHARVPRVQRGEKGTPCREQILELHARCKGNLVRVHEELTALGVVLSYPGLTAFCRRHGIGQEPPTPAGHYDFAPGQEMQHDTSPQRAPIAGRMTRIQTASLALCYSRMLFFQCYPRFRRFECKVFLTDALTYCDGACTTCMIDNTHVVVLSGSGRTMVPTAEMTAFGERFGFAFKAHAIGHANRSARVERPFHYIENNFLAGRSFESFEDLNAQARAWCDKVNATEKRHLHASPRELFATEHARMKRLPAFVPEVYELHHRIVDTDGYVCVRAHRYSVPFMLIGRDVEIRESKDRIDVFEGPRRVATHLRILAEGNGRVTLPEHRPPRNEGAKAKASLSTEEKRLVERLPESADYVALMRKRGRGHVRDLRWLLRMTDEYPRTPMRDALLEATRFGMTDLERLERMILRRIARDFFTRPDDPKDDDDDR
jgi:transposase